MKKTLSKTNEHKFLTQFVNKNRQQVNKCCEKIVNKSFEQKMLTKIVKNVMNKLT